MQFGNLYGWAHHGYSHDVAGVTVDLLAGTATDGSAGTDTLVNIQNVVGSAFDDVIAGDSHNNLLDGGGGINTIDYSHDPAGVTVDLSMGTATDGWSSTDTLTNFQNVIGSAYDDTITGDSHDNVIVGGAGNDIIDGGGGINTVDYSNGPAPAERRNRIRRSYRCRWDRGSRW